MILKTILKNFYDVIDLDLPSGNLWSRYNLGSLHTHNSGLFFKWGELNGIVNPDRTKNPDWKNYKWATNYQNIFLKYIKQNDGRYKLEPEDDAATMFLGKRWCIPTKNDFEEILKECNWERVLNNGIYCYKVSSKKNSAKFIYLPIPNGVVDYWTSELADKNNSAICISGIMTYDTPHRPSIQSVLRYEYCSIRPVIHKI